MTTAPIQEPTQPPQNQNRSRNIFEDPAIQDAAKSDPFTRFVVQNWKTVLITLLAVAGIMISYDFFTTTALQKRANATARLSDVQELYQTLVEAQDTLVTLQSDQGAATDEAKKKELTTSIDAKTKEIDSAKAKLSLMTDALGEDEPFATLARLYKGLIAGRFKDYAAVNQALGALPAWASIKNKDSSERFVAETATLGLAKSLAQSDQHRKAAKEQLQALAENGSFLAVEAAGALYVLLETAEERAAFATLIESVKSRFPSQEGYLKQLK